MKQAKINFWKKYKVMFGFILFIIGALVFSVLTNDPLIGVVLATVVPIVWIKDGQFDHELTDNEIKALEKEDAVKYIKELNQWRIEKVRIDLEEQMKKLVSEEAFNKIQKDIKSLNKKNEDNLEAKVQEVEEMMKNLGQKIEEANKLKGNQNLSKFEIKLVNTKTDKGEELIDALKTHKDGKRFKFQIKATFTGSDVTTLDHHVASQRIPSIGQIGAAKLVLSNFFKVSPIQIDGKGVAVYEDWDEATIVSAAAFIAEAGTFPSSAAKFKPYSITIEKIGDSISMTYESVRDFATFTRELTRFLTRNIAAVVNQALWNGTGVTPQFSGIYTQTTAFVPGTYTGATTSTPNLLDLINVLKKAIMNGKDDKYDVDFVFVSWEDYLELEIAKDTTGRLLYPLGVPSVGGVEIIPTSFVTDNTLVIGDRDYVEMIGDPNIVELEMGYKTGDWEDDKESLKGRTRSCLLIRNADLDGFLKVIDTDAAIVAITT